jgi:hypothetical protein
MIEMCKPKPVGRIVKRVITRRYPHREETYTYNRYYLVIPEQLQSQLPPNFKKRYKMTDVLKIPGTNNLKVVFSPREKASS